MMKINLFFILILSATSLKSQVPSTPFVVRRPELRVTSMTLSVSGSQIAYDFRIADGGSTPVECGFIYSYNTIYPNGDNDPNETYSDGPSPGHGNFIRSRLQDGNWMNPNPSTTSWAGTTAINNPCPSGWRIPTTEEWTWFMTNLRVSNNSKGFNASTAYSNDFNIKLPSGGQRHRLNGALTNDNNHGYWLNNTSDGGVRIIYFIGSGDNNNWGEGGDAGAYGAGVRCIQN